MATQEETTFLEQFRAMKLEVEQLRQACSDKDLAAIDLQDELAEKQRRINHLEPFEKKFIELQEEFRKLSINYLDQKNREKVALDVITALFK